MISTVPFDPSLAEPVFEFWRTLHPDWTWLADSAMRAAAFAPSDSFERRGYLIRRDGVTIATVFGNCALDPNKPRNRHVNIEARPEDIAADWLDPLLASFVEPDRACPGTWHVASPAKLLWPVLVPRLEAAGFALHETAMEMEWDGGTVPVVDPGPMRFEPYAGGDREIDNAIVDLHNRGYRARLVSHYDPERMWTPSSPRITAHECMLARDGDRLVGFADWFVVDDRAVINNLVAARSHWGTAVAPGLGSRTMQRLVDLGHRKLRSFVVATNAASMKLHHRLGWRMAAEEARTYVRQL